jgi:hypothetical protein
MSGLDPATAKHLSCRRYVLPHHAWDRLNLAMMGTLLFVPLTLIAFFESTLNTTAHQRLKQYFSDDILEDEDDPELQDPEEAEEGTICKEKFADLIAVFPKYVPGRVRTTVANVSLGSTGLSASAALSQEIEKLQKQVTELQQMLKNQNGKAA